MSVPLTVNGAIFNYPVNFDTNWGIDATGWAQAVTSGMLQKAGGGFPLTSEVDFGASFGLKTLYVKSEEANIASTGIIRLANASTGLVWRNHANTGDLPLTTDSSNNLLFNGIPIGSSNTLTNNHIFVGNAFNVPTDVAMSGDATIVASGALTISSGAITDSKVASGAAISVNKLAALTANRAVATDGSGFLTPSTTTAVELGYVSGVTSSIQTQLNGKQASGSYALTNLSNVAAVSADVSLNSHKLTSIADGTTNTDAAAFGQLPAQSGTITNWTTYNASPGGFNSPSGQAYWRRIGDTLEVHGYYTAATFAAATVTLNLPSVTVDDSKTSTMTTGGTMQVGFGSALQNSGGMADTLAIFYDSSNTSQLYVTNSQNTSNTSFARRNADTFFGASTPTAITFNFTVPISGWSI